MGAIYGKWEGRRQHEESVSVAFDMEDIAYEPQVLQCTNRYLTAATFPKRLFD